MKRIPTISLIILAACWPAMGQTAEATCPEISVVGPDGLTAPGDTITFTANVKNLVGLGDIKYEWNISAGTIETGQGTSSIEVRTTQDMQSGNVTAVVTIESLAGGCIKEASETAGIAQIISSCPAVDQFGRMSRNDIRARIDNFTIRLANDPDVAGVLIIRLNERESRALKLAFLNNIYEAFVFLKFNTKRITFVVVKGAYETEANLWVVPASPEEPVKEDGGFVIKGTEFKQRINDLFKTNK